jgi:uncharacterized membrane protein SpoIIM required for sporulation
MREGKFIDKNIERWRTYLEESNNADEQANRFVNLIDDLSFAKTFYPSSKTTQFVNGLAAKQFQFIYQNRKRTFNRLFSFWKYELPLLFIKYQRIFLFSFSFFILCVNIGAVAAKYDSSVLSSVLSQDYVDMTEENIAKGDPFGVYKQQNELGMFIRIASNNIQVAMMTFVLGILAGIGSLYMLFTNALMLGAFEYFFFSKGLGWASVLVIWIHGTFEISAIVIAGTAGLVLGNAWLFPQTFTRVQSLKQGAKDAVKIFIATIPFFLVAAFLEGFVTRHTNMPLGLSIMILFISSFVIVWYFVVYPMLLKRSGAHLVHGKIKFENDNA